MIIELDVDTPWEPPPRGRRRRRWPALAAVALVALATPVAAAPWPDQAPRFSIEHQVLSVDADGDRLFVRRFGAAGEAPWLSAVRLRDGAPLWSMRITLQQYVAFETPRTLVLTAEPAGRDVGGTVTAVDVATGRQRWQREQARLVGQAGGRIVVEEVTDAEPVDEDPLVNHVPQPPERHFFALDELTGAPAWAFDVPAGSVADIEYGATAGDYYRLSVFADLDPTGLLRLRDPGTGAVTATQQLRWSGTPAWLTIGDGATGQLLLYLAGERGVQVFDRVTGERLWTWPGNQHGRLFACASDRYCATGDAGLEVLDARTGRLVWRMDDRYAGVTRIDERFAILDTDDAKDDSFAVVDMRTGAIVRRIQGWRIVWGEGSGRLIVWRPVDTKQAVLATLDPRSGAVRVFGKAGEWYGQPECVVEDTTLACVVVGALSVWTLPPDASA